MNYDTAVRIPAKPLELGGDDPRGAARGYKKKKEETKKIKKHAGRETNRKFRAGPKTFLRARFGAVCVQGEADQVLWQRCVRTR